MAKFQYQDICYPSENEAFLAYMSVGDTHYNQNSGIHFFTKINGTVNATGLVSHSVRWSASNNSGISPGYTYQLSSCDSVSSNAIFDKMPIQDILVAAAIVVVFVLGIGQGWKS